MNQKLIDFILNLFAFITKSSDKEFIKLAELYVEQFFYRIYGAKIAKSQRELFVKLVDTHKLSGEPYDYSVDCEHINAELPQSQRLQVLNYLLEYVNFIQKNDILHSTNSQTFNLVFDVAKALNISEDTFWNCKKFVADEFYEISDKHNLVYAKAENPGIAGVKYLNIDHISGYYIFYNFEETSLILFKYFGSESATLNSQIIFPRKTYAIRSGSVIAKAGKPIIFYSDVINKIKGIASDQIIELCIEGVDFKYPGSSFGITNLNLKAQTGELIGVMGGSGVGKSTLFNIINGNFTPQKGSIKFNGHDFRTNRKIIQDYLGFVPQDDSLFERLTVFENLFYTAKLSQSIMSDDDIENLVNNKLAEFGLFGIRNLQVGSPVQRNISGGQRKRLNIVSEIIRNPKLLLVDEPTSGLSSSDSLKIMSLLKEQVLQGCLTIVNIHQPSTEIFRLFDKILILDEGGVMIYYGNPLEAIRYFKSSANKIDSDVAECLTCKNIRSDEIFDIVEERKVNEFGSVIEERKTSSLEWSVRYLDNKPSATPSSLNALPKSNIQKPKYLSQLHIYLWRFLLSKFRDKEFFVFTLLIPMMLSMVIAFFSKYYTSTDTGGFTYSFYQNTNIPIFFLTSIIANIFLGMILTSDTIIKDANINKREYFLFLSQSAYYNSKVIFFLLLSVVQSLIYTLISVWILEIKGMVLEIWLVLFIMSITGNIAGLLVSTLFKSISAVYLIVPFLVIPQIIFCGITIPFDKINYKVSNSEFVPIIGNLSPSMWSTEALLVKQFKDNKYQRNFFSTDMAESQSRISAQYLIPKMFQIIDHIKGEEYKTDIQNLQYHQIQSGLAQLNAPQNIQDELSDGKRGGEVNLQRMELFLEKKQRYGERLLSVSQSKHDSILNQLIKVYGSQDSLLKLRQIFTNKGVESLALARNEFVAISTIGGNLVQVIDPVYKVPGSAWGRAHFMSPYKIIGSVIIDTYLFNVLVLILFVAMLYVALITNCLNRIKKFLFRW